MNPVAARPPVRQPLEADFVERFGAALARMLWGNGSSELERLLAGAEHAGRRDELARLVHDVEREPSAVRADFGVAVHPVQVRSKLWLIDELARHVDLPACSLVVLGAWYGILPLLLTWRLARAPERMLCVDVDPAVCDMGARVIGSLYANVEYRCGDLTQLDYHDMGELPSPVLVNTSCEHVVGLTEWWERVPPGRVVAVQSNDFRACPEHVNCVESTAELAHQTPMAQLLFAGALELPDMRRFMLIGRR